MVLVLGNFVNLLYGKTSENRTVNVTIFAASSLTESLTDVGDLFMANNLGYEVLFNFAGTSTINAQLQQGAKADIFAAASEGQMKIAYEAGLINDYTIFARNKLILITPIYDSKVDTLDDIGIDGVRVIVANEFVPSGDYFRKVLSAIDKSEEYGDGFYDKVIENVVSEEANVRQVLAKILLGEADAGLVYFTDVMDNNRDLINIITIPNIYMPEILYPMAILNDVLDKTGASKFMEFVLSNEAQNLLSEYGFGIDIK